MFNLRLAFVALLVGIAVTTLGQRPPHHTVIITVASNVAAGSALHVATDRPELSSMTTTGAVRMFNSGGNSWVGRIAIQGSTVSTSATYRFTPRTTSSTTHCTTGNGNLSGTAFTTNLPSWNPGYSGKTIYYHSTWTNVVVHHRVGETETWTDSAVMTRIGQGRNAGEHRYRVEGVGEPGRPLEFVLRGMVGTNVVWDNPTVGGLNNNYYTRLDAFFIQDKNIFNYIPPATVSAPQVITVANWPSSYTANGIPSRGGRIYLPRGYTQNTSKRYPVLYMHDGQNVFDPGGAFGSWSADAAATREITQGRMRETIIVAVNNTGSRMSEYGTPQDGYTGNYYLMYLANNVRPTINASYRTLTNRMDTGNMGSSLGGLISAYIGLSSNVFGLVGAVSPSYWYGPNFRNWINTQPTKGARIWQCAGTDEGASMWDHFWPVYTYYLQDDYIVNDDLKYAIGCGQGHNEAAWAARVAGAFQFLYNPWDEVNQLDTNVPPSPGTLQFTAAATNIAEAAGSVRVYVSRLNGSNGAASVTYATSNGTAAAGTDYTAASGTLNWTNNDSATKFIDIAILDDAIYEGDETFTVRLSAASGAALGSPAIITVTILDNESPPPQLVITNPPGTIVVGEATASYTLQGTAVASNWQGLAWSNSLTGASGEAPVANAWSIPGIGLDIGANLITVRATNGQPVVTTNAADNADDDAYVAGWADGSNGGFGFGPWTLNTSSPSVNSNGHFIGTSPTVFIGTPAWGLYANGGNLSEAKRPLPAPLGTNQELRVHFENGIVNTGAGVGVALQNNTGDTLWQFFYNGGDPFYSISGNTTDIPSTTNGLHIAVGFTGPNTYRAAITPLGGTTRIITGDVDVNANSMQATVFRVWNFNAGPDSIRDVFMNNLRVVSIDPAGSVTGASVLITREAPTLHDGIPLSWWNAYGLGTNSSAGADLDNDGFTNWEEYVAGTNPTNFASFFAPAAIGLNGASLMLQAGPPTTNTRVYEVWHTPDLTPSAWSVLGTAQTGAVDGGPLWFNLNVMQTSGFYRTGVRLP